MEISYTGSSEYTDKPGAVNRLPYQVKQALVRACREAFWYKGPLIDMFLDSGVPSVLVKRYEGLPKVVMAKHILTHLESMGPTGFLIQKRWLTNMCRLRKPVDDSVQNMDHAVSALRALKEVALEENLVRLKEQRRALARKTEVERLAKSITEKQEKLENLRIRYTEMCKSEDHQKRGYSIECLISELFDLNGIQYKRAIKKPTSETDGSFHFNGFDYLVEVRWREKRPSLAEIGGFKAKVDRAITSTRGLFIAIQGFREEVIQEFSGEGAKLIFMDGGDIIHMLEDRMTLTEALQLKTGKAAEVGDVFYPIYR